MNFFMNVFVKALVWDLEGNLERYPNYSTGKIMSQ